MTSVRYFFSPLVLSSQERVWIRPSTNTCLPFVRYWPAISACLPKQTTLCHSVASWRLPSRSFQRRLVATLKLATRCPEGGERTSGSRPRLPTRITLFTMGRCDLLLPAGPAEVASGGPACWVGESIMPPRSETLLETF